MPLIALSAYGASLNISWDAVTTNVDTSPCSDLKNYTLKVGPSSGNYSQNYDAALNTSYTLALAPGDYCMVVTAVDTAGNESAPSTELCIKISAQPKNPDIPDSGTLAGSRTVPLDFSGSGESNIVTVSKQGRTKADLLFKIYEASGTLSDQVTFGKFGNIPAPADYDGDGIVDLAVVAREKGKYVWKMRNADSSVSTAKFGRASDMLLTGCNLDADVIADKAVISGRNLKFTQSTDNSIAVIKLKSLPRKITALSCGDTNGDGMDEVLILAKGSELAARSRRRAQIQARPAAKLLVYNPLTGEQLANYAAGKPNTLLIAADMNNDGAAEPAYTARSSSTGSLNFFVASQDAAVPVEIDKFAALVEAKLGSGPARIADGIVYTAAGSQSVKVMGLDDLSSTETSIQLDKTSKEKLVKAVNFSLGTTVK